MGTYGSRSIAVGGTAIVKAVDKIVAKGKKIAAHLMEAAEADIEFTDGAFVVRGTDKKKRSPKCLSRPTCRTTILWTSFEPGLNENAFYDPANFTFPAGSHICEVEVDPIPARCALRISPQWTISARSFNPMIVEGQVHGGLTQGIGQALTEGCHYDRSPASSSRAPTSTTACRGPTTFRHSRWARKKRPARTIRSG